MPPPPVCTAPAFAASSAEITLITSMIAPRFRRKPITLVATVATVVTSFPLEPEVLQRLRCTAIQHRRPMVVTPPCCQVALGDPRRSPVRCRGELRERLVGGRQGLFRFAEPV